MVDHGVHKSIEQCKDVCKGSHAGFAVESLCQIDGVGRDCVCLKEICNPSPNMTYEVFKYTSKSKNLICYQSKLSIFYLNLTMKLVIRISFAKFLDKLSNLAMI